MHVHWVNMCVSAHILHHSCVFASLCVCVCFLRVFVVRRWGANNRPPSGFKRRKSNNINKTAVSVTRVTFAVTGDRHRRGARAPRISLKSALNCAAGFWKYCLSCPWALPRGRCTQLLVKHLPGLGLLAEQEWKTTGVEFGPECGNVGLLKH